MFQIKFYYYLAEININENCYEFSCYFFSFSAFFDIKKNNDNATAVVLNGCLVLANC